MPRTESQKAKIDRELRRMGFGGLNDPNLCVGIAYYIRDHKQFRGMLFAVMPEERRRAYEALRPHLRFDCKPLDVYEAEMKDLAERQQLPQYDKRTGELIPMKVGEVNLDLLATEAIQQNRHEKDGGLLLSCCKCTTQMVFRAKLRKEAEKDSHTRGWRSDGRQNWCPDCVPSRCTLNLQCFDCQKSEAVRCWDQQDGYAAARLRGWVIEDAAVCSGCAVKRLTVQ